ADHPRNAEVVEAVVGEEVLVFGGEDRIADDRWNVRELRDLPVLSSELDERLALDVVDVADGGKLEPHERPQVRQVLALKVDVIERVHGERRRGDRCGADEPRARQQYDDATGPEGLARPA